LLFSHVHRCRFVWLSLLGRSRFVFPDLSARGLFRLIRQPFYGAFALTLRTVLVWTLDQPALAASYTGYCLLAPGRKERRFAEGSARNRGARLSSTPQ